MIIRCKQCNLALTGELLELKNIDDLSEIENEDFIQKGYYYVSDGAFFTASGGKIIIHKGDLLNSKNHSDIGRLNGCCGLDGADGLNKMCNNGHEIATERSDCWIPHCVIFEPGAVEIVH